MRHYARKHPTAVAPAMYTDTRAGWCRLQVEAVENHMPEIVIVDEIGTEAEALACRTIAERGVQLIATAHGQLLENLLKNPTLSDLVGGIQSVTLGAQFCDVLHTWTTPTSSPRTFCCRVPHRAPLSTKQCEASSAACPLSGTPRTS